MESPSHRECTHRCVCAALPRDELTLKKNGFVHEFRAAWTLLGAFTGGSGISGLLSQFPGQGWVDSAHAVTFVTDHDTVRFPHSRSC